MKALPRTLAIGSVVVALVAALAWGLRPAPLRVDLGRVEEGPMQISVDEQAETRAHDRYTVVAPVAGRLSRIALHDGDAVALDQVLATLAPVPLSAQDRQAQLARVAAAEALAQEADARARHAEEDLAQARREQARVEQLVERGFMSSQAVEQARVAETSARNDAAASAFHARSAAADVRLARAGLLAAAGEGGRAPPLIALHAPVAGRVLRVPDASERVVAAGTALMTLGDLSRIEIVAELLSTEAVRIAPGMPVRIDGWGGGAALRGTVRTVEPMAFTKVSALGVEEKRANVVIDLADPPPALGHGYRVDVHIDVWRADKVLKVPASALHRCAQAWCVFRVLDGVARQVRVEVGERNPTEARITGGLQAGDVVVRYPGNALADGRRVTAD
jgi:HlyD family secretion protein